MRKNAFNVLYALFAKTLQKSEKTSFFTLFPSIFSSSFGANPLARRVRRGVKTLVHRRVFRKSTVSNVFYKKIIDAASFVFKDMFYKKQKGVLFILFYRRHSIKLSQTPVQKLL